MPSQMFMYVGSTMTAKRKVEIVGPSGGEKLCDVEMLTPPPWCRIRPLQPEPVEGVQRVSPGWSRRALIVRV
jgi:hypothetical protein